MALSIPLDKATFTRNCSSLGALSLLVWEYIIYFPLEIKYIWRRPFNFVKLLYLSSRYFALIVQTANAIMLFLPAFQLPIRLGLCKVWFVFLFSSVTITAATFDCVLMLRVYALYGCDKRIATGLFILLATNLSLAARSNFYSYRHDGFDSACTFQGMLDVVPLQISITITEVAIGSLTLMKRTLGIGEARALVGLVVRDGGLAFITMFAALPFFGAPHTFISKSAEAHFTFIFPQAIFSAVTCRIILNMQQLQGGQQRNPGEDSFELTTIIDMDSDYSIHNISIEPRETNVQVL